MAKRPFLSEKRSFERELMYKLTENEDVLEHTTQFKVISYNMLYFNSLQLVS